MVSNLQLGRYQGRSMAFHLLDRAPECGCEDVPATLTDDGYFVQCEECEEKENEGPESEGWEDMDPVVLACADAVDRIKVRNWRMKMKEAENADA